MASALLLPPPGAETGMSLPEAAALAEDESDNKFLVLLHEELLVLVARAAAGDEEVPAACRDAALWLPLMAASARAADALSRTAAAADSAAEPAALPLLVEIGADETALGACLG